MPFRYRRTPFPQFLSGLFLNGYKPGAVKVLCIKHWATHVFWHNGPVRRLAIRPGAIGDLIVSLPALESLRSEYFEVWVSSPQVPLVRFADRVRSIASTGLDLLGIAGPPTGLLDALHQFDSIVSWYGANRPEFRELVHYLGLPFQFRTALPAENASVHATDFYLDQVRELSIACVDP